MTDARTSEETEEKREERREEKREKRERRGAMAARAEEEEEEGDICRMLDRLKSHHCLLERSLHKNRMQHRRGRYFKELSMLKRQLTRFQVRQSLQIQDPTKADLKQFDLKSQRKDVLVNCVQLEHLGLLVIKCASTLTSLLSRTHFMPFSLFSLTLLSQLRPLLTRILSENVKRYNNSSHDGGGGGPTDLPETLQLDLERKPYPNVRCHWNLDTLGKPQALLQDIQVGEEVEDFDEEKLLMPIIDDHQSSPHAGRRKGKWQAKAKKVSEAHRGDVRTEATVESSVPPEQTLQRPLKMQKVAPSCADEVVKKNEEEKLGKTSNSLSAFVAVESSPKDQAGDRNESGSQRFRASFMMKKDPQAAMDDIFSQLGSRKKKKKKKVSKE